MSAEESNQSPKTWFRVYSDGIGIGSLNYRLSNAPRNISFWAKSGAAAVMAASNYLSGSASAAPAEKNSYSDQYICHGSTHSYYFEAPNHTPYQIVLADTDEVSQVVVEGIKKKWEFPESFIFATQRLDTFLCHISDYCGGNVAAGGDHTYQLSRHILEIPYTQRACNVSALLHAENMPADQEFESCLTKHITTIMAETFLNKPCLKDYFSDSNSMMPVLMPTLITLGATAAVMGAGYYCFFKKPPLKRIENINDAALEKSGHDAQLTPAEYICSITRLIMDDPVTASDGKTYERKAIENWMSRTSKPLSPELRVPFANTNLVPAVALKTKIDTYVKNKIEEYAKSNESKKTM